MLVLHDTVGWSLSFARPTAIVAYCLGVEFAGSRAIRESRIGSQAYYRRSLSDDDAAASPSPSPLADRVADGCVFDHDLAEFESNMNIQTLHIGMRVRHPQYGVGVVRSLTEQTAEITFDDAPRTIAPASSDLQPAEATATLSELEMPLANLIRDTAHAVVEALGLEQKDVLVEGLATRWQRGTLSLQPADSSLQPKEVPLETFFHKIVMIRNNLRVLEQKVNASDKLSDADKFDLQQYITRCYGSLTTFNILFKNKDDQFRSGA
jgi:hypothetical protein